MDFSFCQVLLFASPFSRTKFLVFVMTEIGILNQGNLTIYPLHFWPRSFLEVPRIMEF